MTKSMITQARGKGRKKAQSAVRILRHDESTAVVATPRMPLFPARSKMMMLPYTASSSLTVPSTSAAVGYVFSLNGLFDPDISGTGFQPMGFDQMMVFYEHYTVYRAEVFVSFRNDSTAASTSAALAVRADVTLSTDASIILETGNSVSTKLPPRPAANALQQFRLEVDVAKFLGFDDLQDAEVARGTVSENPAEQLYAHLYGFNQEALVGATVYFDIRINYYARFSEPRIITRSLAKILHRSIMDEEYKQCQTPTPRCRRK